MYSTCNKYYDHINVLMKMSGMYTFVQDRQKSDLPRIRYVPFCRKGIK